LAQACATEALCGVGAMNSVTVKVGREIPSGTETWES
jgi:hypothetical protein